MAVPIACDFRLFLFCSVLNINECIKCSEASNSLKPHLMPCFTVQQESKQHWLSIFRTNGYHLLVNQLRDLSVLVMCSGQRLQTVISYKAFDWY